MPVTHQPTKPAVVTPGEHHPASSATARPSSASSASSGGPADVFTLLRDFIALNTAWQAGDQQGTYDAAGQLLTDIGVAGPM